MNHDVYICYSTEDSEIANRVCEVLEQNNIRCWIYPRNGISNEDFSKQIRNAVKNSKIVLLIFSTNSFKSHLIMNEIDMAFSSSIPVISFRIDEQDFQENNYFSLTVNHWIDGYPDIENSNLVIDLKELLGNENHDMPTLYKPQEEIKGINNSILNENDSIENYSTSPYIYLSYDDKDLNFINGQINQYESQDVNFKEGDDYHIKDSALLVAFISKNSHKSSKIKNDIVKAISENVDILLVHLDDVKPDFGRLFRLRYGSKFKNSIKYSILKYELDEITYINKYSEIFKLYGVNTQEINQFKNLENLVKTSDEITLTEDICIKDNDSAIDFNRDNLVIEGRGHSISAENAGNIFNINSKNIVLKEIRFKDCSLNDASSIITVGENASLILDCCIFESNYGQVIFNSGEIKIMESNFQANSSNNSQILSKGHLIIENSKFESNKSHHNGSAILNEGKLYIQTTLFTDNECENKGEAKSKIIFNEGMFEMAACKIVKNISEITIENGKKGILSIFNSEFANNKVLSANIYNRGTCNAKDITLESNEIDCENSFEIYNEGDMNLKRFKINENAIYNDGTLITDRPIDCGTYTTITTGIDKPFKEPKGIVKPQEPVVGKIMKHEDNHEGEVKTCPDCGSADLIFYQDLGEYSCKRCGRVIEENISDTDLKWRGIFKNQDHVAGENSQNSYVYLSYDETDLDVINSQISQYENLNVNYKRDNPSEISKSSLLGVYVSKNSFKSLKIKDDINDAYESDIAILLIYLDDVKSEFKEFSQLPEEDSKTFTIDKYELSELEYISKLSEIYQLYGVKRKDNKDEMSESKKKPEIPKIDGLTFTDLDSLIQNSNKITLTDDVHLKESESQRYENGIEIKRDDLIIEGNNHSISAENINKIFNTSSKNIVFKDLTFRYCSLNDKSAVINVNENSSATLDNCKFQSNDLDNGHVIFSLGDVSIKNSKFEDNHSKNEGTAIFARTGSLNITDSEFINNKSQNSGGAILNWVKLNIKDCRFINNHAEGYGGAIGNVIDAVLSVTTSEFIENEAISEGSAIYNENKADCTGCNFMKNNSKLSLIYNENAFDLVNCNFKNNSSRIIIQNHENGVSYISNSKFIENEVIITNIYNNGEFFSLEKVEFKDNKSSYIQATNIYNETYMRLKQPKLDDNSILNTGHIDIWTYKPDLINNNGSVSVMDGPCDKEFSFDWLERKINKSTDKVITLENNIRLENCELDFYEGGMEISRNNLVIDGAGHYIDAAKRTAIFYVTGKNITLRNIKFKNANLINSLYRHTTGGSAIRTVTSSSLKVENCEFINNECDDDGGAILNKSHLEVLNSRFENNNSKTYGGAIYNKNTLTLYNNEFKDNNSRIKEDIFNSKIIKGNYSIENVFDLGDRHYESESFSRLKELVKTGEVILNQDIKFDYKKDHDLKNGIEIADMESLTIDGNGYSIDGDDTASLFNLNNSNVTFKNITFKNAMARKISIFENNAKVTFINCRFINNHSSSDKSLINNNNHIKLEKCQFINNLSKKSLISNNDELTITDCDFAMNSNEKSTISNEGNLSIASSRFINNHSNESAGAIRNSKEGKLEVNDSYFISNSASSSGGAILNHGNIIFYRCSFESNFANRDGGVINNEEDANIEILESDIINNSSKGDGGSIINWGNLSFKNSRFAENTAKKDGGVVNLQKGTLHIDSCEFDNNNAFDGGSIFNRGELLIENSRFENNSAKKDGGVINTYDGNIKILKSIFENNNADDGGAIYSREGKILVCETDFLKNNADINGGAIITWCVMRIEYSRLINNHASIYGGAINNQKELLALKNCELQENKADTGGAIFNVENNNLKTDSCGFRNNSPDDIY